MPWTISRQDVANAVANSVNTKSPAKVGNSLYYIKVNASGIELFSLRDLEVSIGHIRGSMSGDTTHVDTVNVAAGSRGKGLGKLLAAAFYDYWATQGAQRVKLGTNDTSGGFWANLGISEGYTTMVDAKNRLWGATNTFQIR